MPSAACSPSRSLPTNHSFLSHQSLTVSNLNVRSTSLCLSFSILRRRVFFEHPFVLSTTIRFFVIDTILNVIQLVFHATPQITLHHESTFLLPLCLRWTCSFFMTLTVFSSFALCLWQLGFRSCSTYIYIYMDILTASLSKKFAELFQDTPWRSPHMSCTRSKHIP